VISTKDINELIQAARKQTAAEQGLDTLDLSMFSTDEIYKCGVDDGIIESARELLRRVKIDWREDATQN